MWRPVSAQLRALPGPRRQRPLRARAAWASQLGILCWPWKWRMLAGAHALGGLRRCAAPPPHRRPRTANASGSSASRDSPRFTRWRNSSVLARSCSSDSACIAGSSALIASTRSWYFLRVFSDASCLNILPKKAAAFTVRARPRPRGRWAARGPRTAGRLQWAAAGRAPRGTERSPLILAGAKALFRHARDALGALPRTSMMRTSTEVRYGVVQVPYDAFQCLD
jgi:hypothetical protein